ncbi:dTMP kinase [Candidatus Bipolaricaulota bacterium]|nr:dTMP kinase [Candidatus Bipolaricaulota bacterium]
MVWQGKLIVFEGLDFTGKSTQARLLGEDLRKQGYEVTLTREPGGTSIGEQVRQILLSDRNHDLAALSELLLFMTCRAQLTREVIEPALAAGNVVISSRYRMSSLAYQGYGRGLDLDLIRRLNDAATHHRPSDLVIFLDVGPSDALARRGAHPDRIEQEEISFFQRIYDGYKQLLLDEPKALIVPATEDIETVAIEIRHQMQAISSAENDRV